MMIFEKVSNILSELSGAEAVALKNRLRDDLTLDSLHMVMLLLELEDKFDIVLDESDMNPFNLVTVEDVVSLVRKYCGDGNEENS